MIKLLGWTLTLLPLVFISLIYYEGGLFGLMLFGLYTFATLCTLVAPIIGILLIKGSYFLK